MTATLGNSPLPGEHVEGRRGVDPSTFRKLAVVTLVANVLIVLTGATVRLTGSGLGCSDWPTCEEGQLIPAAEYHALIEFLNRSVLTTVVSLAVAATVVAAIRRTPRRSDLVRLSWGLVAGVLGQILLGGVVVLTHLTPWSVIGHFALSMVLIWNCVLLIHRAGLDDSHVARTSSRVSRPQAWVITGLSIVALFTGTLVTGSGPHAGNDEGQFVERLPFDVPDIARIHGITVVALLIAVVSTLVWLRRSEAPQAEQRRIRIVLGVLLAQGAIGYTQYFTGVPALLVGFHVAGACALWIAVLWFHLTSTPEPLELPHQLRLRQPSLVQP